MLRCEIVLLSRNELIARTNCFFLVFSQALRGAQQIIEVAIETLKQDLPPPPPTVEELRAMNSKILTKKVEDERLNAIKYRNQIPPEKEYVGRL